VTLAEPFFQVAFLPLPAIAHLKIPDRGLVDADKFELVRDQRRRPPRFSLPGMNARLSRALDSQLMVDARRLAPPPQTPGIDL
jgi:hypothetical protein